MGDDHVNREQHSQSDHTRRQANTRRTTMIPGAKQVILWALLFAFCTGGIVMLLRNLPSDEEISSIFSILPTNLPQLQKFHSTLAAYTDRHFPSVITAFAITYIYKQSFSIPGSVLLNVIAGALFPLSVAFPLCCVLSALGSSGAYWISHFLGREIVEYWMPTKLQQMQIKVTSQQMGLFPYLVFIRLFPFTPNWFINLASPLINVPFFLFAASVFVGLMPYNFITTQAGDLVNELHSTRDIFSFTTICKMLAVSFVFAGVFLGKKFLLPRMMNNPAGSSPVPEKRE